MIAAYVSGHGFGHATRVTEVLRAVRELEPAVPLSVVTSGPEALYRQALTGPFEFRAVECDVGLAQKDALTIDEEATLERCREFEARREALVTAETRWLRRVEARVVLGDIPPLAFEAAAEAGVPSVGLGNFSWDWIYRHLSARHPGLAETARLAEAAYRRAALLLRLPFAGDLSAFPRIEDIPLVARRPRVGRQECRRRLRLPEKPVILLSFGGLGLPRFDPQLLAGLEEFTFLTTGGEKSPPAHARSISARDLEARGLGYQDLVGAADVVVTKPGYGIVSDAIGARTRVVYTERGDFPEYDVLVREMSRLLPCVHASNEDLLAGRLGGPIRAVLALPMPEPPDMGGAAVAARRLLEMAAGRQADVLAD